MILFQYLKLCNSSVTNVMKCHLSLFISTFIVGSVWVLYKQFLCTLFFGGGGGGVTMMVMNMKFMFVAILLIFFFFFFFFFFFC